MGYPNLYIIDRLGLNDYVIARTQPSGPLRLMAHEKQAPQGYIACFSPNVRPGKRKGEIITFPRINKITDTIALINPQIPFP